MTNEASTWGVLKLNDEGIFFLGCVYICLPECSYSTISDSTYLFSDVRGLRLGFSFRKCAYKEDCAYLRQLAMPSAKLPLFWRNEVIVVKYVKAYNTE